MKIKTILALYFSLFTVCGYAQKIYFTDGYHGGVFGHYPEWKTAFIMDKLEEHPGWRVNMEIEPETYDSVKVWHPDIYKYFQQFMADQDGKLIEFTNPTYAQPYCYNISGESLIRQFTHGMKKLYTHFPDIRFHTYAVEEPCFTSSLPQLLKQLGFRYAVLKNPDTCYGGYTAAHGGESVWWIGPDGTRMLTIPRYEVEALEENSTWQTIAWNNSGKYIEACLKAGIPNPIGMCYQDAGWKNGPWVGKPENNRNTYTLWTPYMEHIVDTTLTPPWKLSQEDIQVSLMWGSQVLQQLAQNIRTSENHLVQAEKIASLQNIYENRKWQTETWEEIWRGLLMSQHHDCWIVPYNNMGSTGKTWAENVRIYTSQSNQLAGEMITSGSTPNGNFLRIYNTLPFTRKEFVTYTLPGQFTTTELIVKDVKGKKTESEILPGNRIGFYAEVPAMGFTTYQLEKGKPKEGKKIQFITLENGNKRVETDLYIIELNPKKGGTIISLYDKKQKKEWIDQQSSYAFNELRGHFYEEGTFHSSAQQPAIVTLQHAGSNRVNLQIEGLIGKQPFTQQITLTQGDPRIDMQLEIDWQGDPRVGEYKEESKWQEVRKGFYDDRYKLHLLFPVALEEQQIYKNAPFDVCESGLDNTFFNSWDQIKNNIILHWVDLYDKKQHKGMTLFTDHTTSYLHGEEYPLGLTVQYAGTGIWSRNYTAKGKTSICYSLLPHTGNWQEADLTTANNRRNEPLHIQAVSVPSPSHSFLNHSEKGLEITAMYYEGEDLILRLYNEGKEGEKQIRFNTTITKIEEIDLNNHPVNPISLKKEKSGFIVTTRMTPFEIKTFRIKLH